MTAGAFAALWPRAVPTIAAVTTLSPITSIGPALRRRLDLATAISRRGLKLAPITTILRRGMELAPVTTILRRGLKLAPIATILRRGLELAPLTPVARNRLVLPAVPRHRLILPTVALDWPIVPHVVAIAKGPTVVATGAIVAPPDFEPSVARWEEELVPVAVHHHWLGVLDDGIVVVVPVVVIQRDRRPLVVIAVPGTEAGRVVVTNDDLAARGTVGNRGSAAERNIKMQAGRYLSSSRRSAESGKNGNGSQEWHSHNDLH